MIKVAMKSTKLLAVLAGAAMFTACTQEELVESNNTPQQMEEIVGAKLVGTDVSLNVSSMSDAKSRWAGGEATWEKEDLVGLGWITNGKPYNSQIVDGAPVKPTDARLYANHKYNYDEETNTWTTQGNLYEGWYFAYYQWDYMPKVAEKTFTVNPTQKTNDQVKHYSERLFISSRKFIEAGKVNTESNTLNEEFKLLPAVKAFRVKTNPAEGSSFANHEKMQTKKIEYITFNTGDETQKIFATELNFAPQNLPVWDVNAEEEDNVEAFYNNLYTGKKPVLSVDAANWTSTLTTNFEGDGKQAAFGDNRLVAYAVPATAELDIEKVSIKIGVEGGYFLINKEDKSKKNLAALQQFVDAYCGEDKEGCGSMTKIDATDGTNWAMTLDIELHDDIFFTDFTQIDGYNAWAKAVEMVEILGRKEATFAIVDTINFENGIYMPNNDCKLKVVRGNKVGLEEQETSSETLANYYFNISGNITGWPANLNTDQIKIVIDGVTVEDAHLISAHQIVNKGILNVPAEETLTSASSSLATSKIVNEGEINLLYKSKVSRVDNNGGRINVIYGSYVELFEGTEAGEIAYIVNEDDATTPSRIKDVIAQAGQSEYALVNILVFDKEKVASFDFTKSTSAKPNDNPYYDNSTDASEYVLVLDNVSLEINGVAVSSSSTEQSVTVKNVTIDGGSINDIIVAGNLTVKGGNVVADVAEVTGALTIEAGQGEITSSTIGSVEIKSDNFTINAQTIEGNVVATGENYFNIQNFNGTVTLTNTSSNYINIDGATFNEDVVLEGNFGLVNVAVEKKLTVKSGNVKMENININGDLTNNGTVIVSGNDAVISNIINNGKLTTNTNITVEKIAVNSGSTVIVAENKTIWHTIAKKDGGYIQAGTTTGSIDYYEIAYASSSEDLTNAINNGKTEIKLQAGTYTIPADAKGKTLTIKGTRETIIDATYSYGQSLSGASITFEGVTVKGEESGNYKGFTHVGSLTFKNCVFEGKITIYSNTVFEGCTFNNKGDYAVWTSWGGNETKFVDCNFYSGGKALLLYGGSDGNKNKKLIVDGCKFYSDKSCANDKAAIETGNDYDATYEIVVTNTFVSEDFSITTAKQDQGGDSLGTILWGNKDRMPKEKLNVVVDGVDVY